MQIYLSAQNSYPFNIITLTSPSLYPIISNLGTLIVILLTTHVLYQIYLPILILRTLHPIVPNLYPLSLFVSILLRFCLIISIWDIVHLYVPNLGKSQ